MDSSGIWSTNLWIYSWILTLLIFVQCKGTEVVTTFSELNCFAFSISSGSRRAEGAMPVGGPGGLSREWLPRRPPPPDVLFACCGRQKKCYIWVFLPDCPPVGSEPDQVHEQPPVNRITDGCKIITFSHRLILLWTAKKGGRIEFMSPSPPATGSATVKYHFVEQLFLDCNFFWTA